MKECKHKPFVLKAYKNAMNTSNWEKNELPKNEFAKEIFLQNDTVLANGCHIRVPEYLCSAIRHWQKYYEEKFQMNQVINCSSSCLLIEETYLAPFRVFIKVAPTPFFFFLFCLFSFFLFFLFFLFFSFWGALSGFYVRKQWKSSTIIASEVWVKDFWHQ